MSGSRWLGDAHRGGAYQRVTIFAPRAINRWARRRWTAQGRQARRPAPARSGADINPAAASPGEPRPRRQGRTATAAARSVAADVKVPNPPLRFSSYFTGRGGHGVGRYSLAKHPKLRWPDHTRTTSRYDACSDLRSLRGRNWRSSKPRQAVRRSRRAPQVRSKRSGGAGQAPGPDRSCGIGSAGAAPSEIDSAGMEARHLTDSPNQAAGRRSTIGSAAAAAWAPSAAQALGA